MTRHSTPVLLRQNWSAGTYDTHARFVSDLADGVVEWLAPQKGERILDVGCGDGHGNWTADYVRLRVEAVK